ncbi:MAG: methionyl-tRNA formyltransferase [Planctomycetes bacterium]|nr:methionyl-tRNA formyltransferase [Planctomycetota bacterium]
MNVALIGSVSSSVTALGALIDAGIEMTAVLGLEESRAPYVSDYQSLEPLALQGGIPFQSFISVTDPKVASFLEAHRPDLLWCIGLSQLIPERLIESARHGGVGFHPTMLPRGRGRAPVAWTILLKEQAAVSLFHLSDEPDAGDIIAQREVAVAPDDYAEDLIARTNDVLRDVIMDLGPSLKTGTLPRTPQDHRRATCYAKRTPADGLIHWSLSTDRIHRLVRAAGSPYPGAFTFLGETKLTIWRAELACSRELADLEAPGCQPGIIIRIDPARGPLVRTADGGLWLTKTTGVDWATIQPGDRALSQMS